jgi:hypothetical protein
MTGVRVGELARHGAEDLGDLAAERVQHSDGNHRNESENQRVLDQRLPLPQTATPCKSTNSCIHLAPFGTNGFCLSPFQHFFAAGEEKSLNPITLSRFPMVRSVFYLEKSASFALAYPALQDFRPEYVSGALSRSDPADASCNGLGL